MKEIEGQTERQKRGRPSKGGWRIIEDKSCPTVGTREGDVCVFTLTSKYLYPDTDQGYEIRKVCPCDLRGFL